MIVAFQLLRNQCCKNFYILLATGDLHTEWYINEVALPQHSHHHSFQQVPTTKRMLNNILLLTMSHF